jgi:hypothetical protein
MPPETVAQPARSCVTHTDNRTVCSYPRQGSTKALSPWTGAATRDSGVSRGQATGAALRKELLALNPVSSTLHCTSQGVLRLRVLRPVGAMDPKLQRPIKVKCFP